MFFRKNVIASAILMGALIIGGVFLYIGQKGCQSTKEEVLTPEAAAAKAIAYINQNMVEEGEGASLVEISEEKGMYMFKINLEGNEYISYMTKDASYLFPMEPVEMDKETAESGEEAQGVSKTEVPNVKLFVMTYCPYGLQAQKGFLPVYNLLNGKADMEVYFVDYIMHDKKEIEENLNQYCIQKEEVGKYGDYLSCFVLSGDSGKCFSEAKIDGNKIEKCVSETDQLYKITEGYNDNSTWIGSTCPDPPYCFPQFNVHANLNEEYGVSGSPTFVINDKVVQISRSPEAIKEAVCAAFLSPPEECSEELSGETPLPSFGGGEGESDSESCG
jgi:hypothetical protein